MKKIAALFALILFTGSTFAQDDTKGFRFGLRVDPMLSWYKPENEKKFENLGTGLGFGWGLHLEFRVAETFSFYSTFGLQYDKGRLSYLPQGLTTADSVYYRVNGDDEFVEYGSGSIFDTSATNALIRLNERTFTVNYANLGFGLKMKTKEIGYLTYFGHFGGNLGIKTKAKANDQVTIYAPDATALNTGGTSGEKSALDVTSELQPLKISLTIGAGAEYNISGTTSLLFGISYNHGVTNVLRKNSDYLFTTKDGSATNDMEAISQQATARNITLTIGILF